MKKLLTILAIAAVLVACGSNNEPKAFKIDPLATVNIKPVAGTPLKVKSTSTTTHLSALEIVRTVTLININYNGRWYTRTFIPSQRDTISATPQLKMWATDVISAVDNSLQPDWVEATDVVFTHWRNEPLLPFVFDTIAYIPNATLRIAETAIKTAYNAKDIDACYTTFNNAYTFIPITGAEWRALKATNQQ